MPLSFARPKAGRSALLIVLPYVTFAGAWIWLSDALLLASVDDPIRYASFQTWKGALFVAVTGGALYLLVVRQLVRFDRDTSLLRFLVERAPDVLFRFRLVPDRAFEFVSPAVKAISGYPSHAFEKEPELGFRIVHPDDRERLEQALSRPEGSSTPVEVRWVRADGEIRWVEVHGAPVRNGGNRVVAMEGIARDVTQRHREDEFRQILEASVAAAGDSIVITDAEARIEYVNPAFERMSGYTAGEVTGQNPRLLNSGKQPVSFYSRMWDRLQGGRPFHAEFVNRRKDGSLYRQEATITPILDREGRTTHYLSVARDVTEKRLLQKQLREAQKAELLGQASGGIAHDCRNLLGVIQAHTDLAARAVEEGRSPAGDLEEIAAAVQRGSRLLKALLSLGRKGELEFGRTDLGELVRQTHLTLQAVFPETVELEIQVEEGLWVEADPGSVHQMILNFATNARDAMPDGGRFVLRAARGGEPGWEWGGLGESTEGGVDWIHVEASDTGVGMDEETRRRAFEPLFTTKPRDRGTGLGLSMVARLIHEHGGRVTIDSSPGEGTTLRLYFPRDRAHAASDLGTHVEAVVEAGARPGVEDSAGSGAGYGLGFQARSGAGAGGEDGGRADEEVARGPGATGDRELPRGRETILVVEDLEPLRRAVSRSLERLGYHVVSTESGREALAALAREEVDLVLTDMVMPEMGGRELFEEMQLVGFGDLPVVFMSGYQLQEVAPQLFQGPSIRFLEKPWTLSHLASTVRSALDRHDSAGIRGVAP